MAEQAYAYVTLIPVAEGFQRAIAKEMGGITGTAGKIGQESGGSFSGGFGRAVRGIGGLIATGLAAAGIGNFFKESVSQASDLEESLNAVNVAYGDAAGNIIALGEDSATRLGIATSEFNAIATRFSSFATTIAGDGGNVTEVIDELSTRGADFASVFNLDVNDALSKFQSGLAGETEPLRQFGIDLSAAAVQSYALANGIAQPGIAMTEQEKVMARYGLLMEQTSAVAGDFSNTSDGLANSQRILSANFENMQATVGAALIPVLAELTTAMLPVIEQLGPVLTSTLEALSPVLLDIAGQIPGLFESFLPLVPVLGDLAAIFLELAADLLPIFVDVLNAVLPVVEELAPIFADFIGDALEKLAPVFVDILDAMLPVIEDTLPIFADLFEELAPLALELIEAVLPLIETTLPIMGDLLENIVVPALQLLVDILTTIVGWFTDYDEKSQEFIDSTTALSEDVLAGWETVSTWFTDLGTTIGEAVGDASEWLSDTGSDIMTGLETGATTAWETVSTWFGDVQNKVTTATGEAGEWLSQTGTDIMNGLETGATTTWETVSTWFGGLKERVNTAAGEDPENWLLQKGNDIINGMDSGIQTAFITVSDWFGGLKVQFQDFIKDPLGWLKQKGKDILNGLWDGLKETWNKIRDWFSEKADEVKNTWSQRLKISSPSKVFFEFGRNINQGLLLGLQDNYGEVQSQVDMMVEIPNADRTIGRTTPLRPINYYAAPNKSFDAEQELRLAMTRARILA